MTHRYLQYQDPIEYQEVPLNYRKLSKILTQRQHEEQREGDVPETESHHVSEDSLQRLWTAWMPLGNRSCPKLSSSPGCSEENEGNINKLT